MQTLMPNLRLSRPCCLQEALFIASAKAAALFAVSRHPRTQASAHLEGVKAVLLPVRGHQFVHLLCGFAEHVPGQVQHALQTFPDSKALLHLVEEAELC